jgi:hypothetical protein
VIRLFVATVFVAAIAAASFWWVPELGSALAVSDPPARADAAVVLEGTGVDAMNVAESWRQQGLVNDVVIVEAPVRTHALVAYWSDLVHAGVAPPSPTPADHLRIVRAPSTQAGQQAEAALPALEADAARLVLVTGGGGIGSRVVERELGEVWQPAGIGLRMIADAQGQAAKGRDPAHWYANAEDRRAVLDSWLQLLVPYMSGYDSGYDAGK